MGRSASRQWLVLGELAVIALWVLWLGNAYLDFDPLVYPGGRELRSTIASHHLWTRLLECGPCAWWNGAQRGGFPALADVHSSVLNPVVALPALLLGVVNGSKVTLLLCLWLAGFAQWWIARLLGLRGIVRVWSGMIAAAAGHLSSRMELGALNVVVATALGSLVIAAIVFAYRSPGLRSTAVLGMAIGGAILGGSGYMQIGLLAVLPALVFLVTDREGKITPVWRNLLAAAGIGLLIAAPLVLPAARFLGNFTKLVDPTFGAAQPLAFLPFNLVINDPGFYFSTSLAKLPYPHLNSLYIGWVPVVLAVIGAGAREPAWARVSRFFLAGAVLVFVVASAIPLRWLAPVIPPVAGIRHPSQMAGMAIPLILGLASIGLEMAWTWQGRGLPFGVGPRQAQLVCRASLVLALAANLRSAETFGSPWLRAERLTSEVQSVIRAVRTGTSQWVALPFGEHDFVEPAIAAGLKLSPGIMTYDWRGLKPPSPLIEAHRFGATMEQSVKVGEVAGIGISRNPVVPYAALVQDDGSYVECAAHAVGGNIDVACPGHPAGRLRLLEHAYAGWSVWMDGAKVSLENDEWLSVAAPAGGRTFSFRFRPWDVPLGVFLGVIGWLLASWLFVTGLSGRRPTWLGWRRASTSGEGKERRAPTADPISRTAIHGGWRSDRRVRAGAPTGIRTPV